MTQSELIGLPSRQTAVGLTPCGGRRVPDSRRTSCLPPTSSVMRLWTGFGRLALGRQLPRSSSTALDTVTVDSTRDTGVDVSGFRQAVCQGSRIREVVVAGSFGHRWYVLVLGQLFILLAAAAAVVQALEAKGPWALTLAIAAAVSGALGGILDKVVVPRVDAKRLREQGRSAETPPGG